MTRTRPTRVGGKKQLFFILSGKATFTVEYKVELDRFRGKKRSRNSRDSEDQNSSVESKILDFYVRSEPEFLQKRTYVLLSPSNEKKTKKRSVDILENEQEKKAQSKLNSEADKSARNYAALKSTDDMFKGGIEQSNPLGEDKPGLLQSFSFSAFSTSVNSSPLFKSFKTKTTTSPEWKVFRVTIRNSFSLIFQLSTFPNR